MKLPVRPALPNTIEDNDAPLTPRVPLINRGLLFRQAEPLLHIRRVRRKRNPDAPRLTTMLD